MTQAVMMYRDVIQADRKEMVAKSKAGIFHSYAEQKVIVKSVDEDLWGTADYLQFIKGATLRVYDFKHGKGIVEAEKNPQMGLYGLGAMETIAGEAFDDIELIIVQPRVEHKDGKVRRWKAPKAWLEQFRVDARAAAAETKSPKARIAMGSWCKWCDAKPTCPAHHEKKLDEAQNTFEVVIDTDDLEAELLGPTRERMWPL